MRGRITAGWAQLDSVADLLATPEARLQLEEWPLLLPLLGMPVADSARVARARVALGTLAGTPDAE
jgi:hypothetical protein